MFVGFEVGATGAPERSLDDLSDEIAARDNGTGRATELLSVARKEWYAHSFQVFDRIIDKLNKGAVF